jgi:Amt family ammonium transporter
VAPFAAIIIGLIAGAVCALAVGLKYKLGYDDSLDVVGVHFVGGWIGSLSIGFFATAQVNSAINGDPGLGAAEGLFYGGGLAQLGRQFVGSAAVTVYSLVIAAIIAFVIKTAKGLRVSDEAEITGIDVAEHAESAYDTSPSTGSAGAFAMAGLTSSSSTEGKAPVSEKVSG